MHKTYSTLDQAIRHIVSLTSDQNTKPPVVAYALQSAYYRAEDAGFIDLFTLCAEDMRDDNPQLYRGALLIANKLDSDLCAAHNKNAYHNTDHLKMVMINAYALIQIARREGFTPPMLDVLVAAMIHDAAHDGTKNVKAGRYIPFWQEDRAMRYGRIQFTEAKVDSHTLHTIHYMLRWTDMQAREGWIDATYPSGVPNDVAEKARILGDADLLSCLGLSGALALNIEKKISREWGKPFRPSNYVTFAEKLGQKAFLSKAGRYFNPNIQSVVAYMRSLAQAKAFSNVALRP